MMVKDKEKTLIALDKDLKLKASLKAKSEGKSLTKIVENLLAKWCNFKLPKKPKKKYTPKKTEHYQLICETVEKLKSEDAKNIGLERWVSKHSRVDILCELKGLKTAVECYTNISKKTAKERYENILPYVDQLIFVVIIRADEVRIYEALGFPPEDYEVWKMWLNKPTYKYNFPSPEELMDQ